MEQVSTYKENINTEHLTWPCAARRQTCPSCCGAMSWPGGRGSDKMAPTGAMSAGPSAQRTTARANIPPPETCTAKNKAWGCVSPFHTQPTLTGQEPITPTPHRTEGLLLDTRHRWCSCDNTSIYHVGVWKILHFTAFISNDLFNIKWWINYFTIHCIIISKFKLKISPTLNIY